VNSKERVHAAIRRERPDKVPLGFYVVDYDIIEQVIGRPTYVRNKVKSQIAFWQGRRDEVVESYKNDTIEFYRKIDIADIVCFKETPIVPPAGFKPENPPRRIADDLWQDTAGRVYKISTVSNEFVCVEDPTLEREVTVEEFEAPIDDTPPDPTIFEACDALIEALGQDRYIAGASGGLNVMVLLGGMQRGLMRYLTEPDVVRAAIRHKRNRGNLMDRYYIRPGQDGVLFEEDMASTKGPLMSPRMFREFCFPALQDRVAHVKQAGMQVLLHNCGNNRLLMDQFVEAGIDGYQSLQTNANMDVADLKAEYGDRLAFWGGIALETLIDGSPEDVRHQVRQALQDGAENGGFILGPSHSIAKGTKYDNFMAMLDEFDRLRDRV